MDCDTYVNTVPAAFQYAYWDIASVHVFEKCVLVSYSLAHPAEVSVRIIDSPSNVPHQIHPNGNKSKCLDVKGGVLANGTPVQMYVASPSLLTNIVLITTVLIATTATALALRTGSSTRAPQLSRSRAQTTASTPVLVRTPGCIA